MVDPSRIGFVMCMVLCTLICVVPIAVANIVMGAISPGDCDYEDKMGMDVSKYLIGGGIASLIAAGVLIFLYMFMIFNITFIFSYVLIIIFSVINVLFGVAWFIIGAVIIFRGNIDCIRDGSAHVIYALVLWCISAWHILMNLLGILRKKKNDDD